MRPPTEHMPDDTAEAYTCNLHMAVPPGALEWTSAQGPASTAAHATLRPPGGPPPEEADSVSEGRHPDNTCVDSTARPGNVRIEEPVIPPAPANGGGTQGDPCQWHDACCPTEGKQGTRLVQATTAARTHGATDPSDRRRAK